MPNLKKEVAEAFKEGEKQRTIQQNSALHLWFTQVAEALNVAGYGVLKIIKVDIPWTPELIKEAIWRTVQEAMCGKYSTTELTTKDIDKIYEVINRALAERTNGNIHVPWPSEEEMLARLEQEDGIK